MRSNIVSPCRHKLYTKRWRRFLYIHHYRSALHIDKSDTTRERIIIEVLKLKSSEKRHFIYGLTLVLPPG